LTTIIRYLSCDRHGREPCLYGSSSLVAAALLMLASLLVVGIFSSLAQRGSLALSTREGVSAC
tara:strand:- start:754 stop:942 length:189 start_codon:yes stop_codon:yes gene_type:complete